MIWITLFVTAVITAALVLAAIWIEKNKYTRPHLYRNRGFLYLIVYLILSAGDFPN